MADPVPTALTAPTAPPHDLARLGTIRRLDRCATEDGFFAVAAIDHPARFHPDPDGHRQPDPAVIADKLAILDGVAAQASAVLLDPTLGLGQAVATGRLPGRVGLISNIELLHETADGLARTTELRPDWTPSRIVRVGADAVKLVFFHREEQQEAAAAQRDLVGHLARRCRAVDLPLVVEPLWYPLEGEGPTDGSARAEAIIRSAVTFAGLGADVLKLQFPGSVQDTRARADAAAAAAELDGAVEVPWVLLSEGVGHDDFAVQVQLAARAGASGFMAGRAVWGEVAQARTADRAAAIRQAGRRLGVLTAIVRAEGRPWRERPPLADVQARLPGDWHRAYGMP